jgi:tetratricopeptide (TPR) repeat protein
VPLLPGSPTCTVLITSRNRLGGLVTAHGARPVSLDVLPDAEARRVLTTHLDPARLAAEPEAATELLSCCAGLPLALSIVSTRAATSPDLPLAALATELRDAATRLDGLDGGDLAVNLRAVFDASYRSLDAEAATVFRLLGLLPATDAGLDMIASLVGRPPAGARTVLRALERANLVRLSATGRYRTHDLVRLYAAELATGRERRTATVRLLDHLLYAVHAADRLVDAQRPVLTPPPCHADVTHPVFADRNAALAWLDAEHMALLGAVTVALDAGFLTHAWQLPRLLTPFLDRRGYWQEMSDVLDVALAAATALGDQRAEAGVHRDLARAHLRLRRPEHATVRLRRALDLYRELDDLVGQAQTNAALAWHLEAQGDVAEALEHARRALALHAAAGHQAGVAEALNAVGWYHALLGDYRSTLDYCGRALAMQRDMGSVALLGDTLDSLGYAHHHLAEYPMAIGYFQESLDVSRQLGARHNEGAVLTHLGDAYLATGDREAAGRAWLAALAVFTDLDAPDADGVRARLADLGVH